MEFEKDKILINEGDEISDITFVAPFSPADKKQKSVKLQLMQLLKEIKSNIWGCDLILCLFIAALNSYRSDRCLRPFPQLYINEDGKNFAGLRQLCDTIPPLNTILLETNKCSEEIIQFLCWLFVEKGHSVLKRTSLDKATFPSQISDIFKPHYIFEVCYSDKFESLWQKRKSEKGVIWAYHGSAVDNFYSILKVGLQQHFSLEKVKKIYILCFKKTNITVGCACDICLTEDSIKAASKLEKLKPTEISEVLFGNGIYLSNEVSVSAHYSPFGQTWKNSALGSKHSVIAICEIINDVEKVKCKDANNKKRSLNEHSMGEIPEKYFVVTDSDMVRVKYLMIYRQKVNLSVKSYVTKHLFLFLIVAYFIGIVAIGVLSNSTYTRSLKRVMFSFFN